MFSTKYKIPLFLFLFSIGSCVFFNELNLHFIRTLNPKNEVVNGLSIQRNEMVFSVDSEYYLTPVENYIDGKGWKRSPVEGNGGYFRRMPGYSLIYFFIYKIFGFENSLYILKLFQILLFSISIVFLYKTLVLITGKDKFSFWVVLPFAFLPFFSGYAYTAITEGITPAVCIIFLYFVFKNRFSNEMNFYNLIWASLCFTFLVFTRPFMAVLGLILLVETLYYNNESFNQYIRHIKRLLIVFSIPFIAISIWTIRNYNLTGEFVPLEKAFHPQTRDRMKPELQGMMSLSKCWGEDGFQFDVYYHPLLYNALAGDTSYKYVENVVNSWPEWFVADFGRQYLLDLVKRHQKVIFSEKKYYDAQIAMPNEYLEGEIKIKEEYDQIIKEFKSRYFFTYYIKSPLIYLKRNVFHSHTSKLAYLGSDNSGIFKKLIKASMYLLHVIIYFALLFNLIFMRFGLDKIVFVYTPIILIFFFCFIHREIEQRYLLPLLPLLIISSVYVFSKNRRNEFRWPIFKLNL